MVDCPASRQRYRLAGYYSQKGTIGGYVPAIETQEWEISRESYLFDLGCTMFEHSKFLHKTAIMQMFRLVFLRTRDEMTARRLIPGLVNVVLNPNEG